MRSVNRYEEYIDGRIEFDKAILDIQSGKLKVGRYAHLVKSKDLKKNRKELFNGKK